MPTVLAIDLATDPLVRAFFQHVGKQGGLAKDAADFIMNKPAMPIPIVIGCRLFIWNKATRRWKNEIRRDASLIGAIWRLLGMEIRKWRRCENRHLVLMNAVYVGAGTPLDVILDARLVAGIEVVALAQRNFVGVAGAFEPVVSEEFSSCLCNTTRFKHKNRTESSCAIAIGSLDGRSKDRGGGQ